MVPSISCNVTGRLVRGIHRFASSALRLSVLHAVALLVCTTVLLSTSTLPIMSSLWMGNHFEEVPATKSLPSFFCNEEQTCTL